MTSPFGARMRQHREQQELCLAAIADRTKIKASLLEALERDDLSRWPPGIYRRAYVRAYADAIGLNADSVIREFLKAYPEPPEIIEAAPPPTGLRGLLGSAIESLSRIRQTERIEHPTETAPTMGRVASPEKASAEVDREIDLLAAAQLCTRLGRLETLAQVQPLLREAAAILGAKGIVVWLWDALAGQLRAVLVHGYPEPVIARLPGVSRHDDNLTAAAFRSAQTLAVSGTVHASGALALPLLTPTSCAGVLAIEFPDGHGETPSVRAVATFFAAMLAQLVGVGAPTNLRV
jgi:helix-turn-helix protein